MSRSYEGFSELFAMEESNQVNTVSAVVPCYRQIDLNCDTDAIDAKVNRLLPGTRRTHP